MMIEKIFHCVLSWWYRKWEIYWSPQSCLTKTNIACKLKTELHYSMFRLENQKVSFESEPYLNYIENLILGTYNTWYHILIIFFHKYSRGKSKPDKCLCFIDKNFSKLINNNDIYISSTWSTFYLIGFTKLYIHSCDLELKDLLVRLGMISLTHA